MKTLLIIALLSPLLLADDAIKDNKESVPKLAGTWQVVQQWHGDMDISEDAKHCQIIFDGEKLTVEQDRQPIIQATFKIVPGKSPAQMDVKILKDEDEQHIGKTALTIFQLDGDKLKICSAEPGVTDRPKEFTSKASENVLVVLERAKK